VKVAAGSVGVASRMTCVFPKETPCGLNIIGRTPAVLWDHSRRAAALLAPGDRVAFEQIGLEDFRRLTELAARAELRQSAVNSRDKVAAKMTPDQIAEAQKMAREWKPK
jgi:hypothetical protein